MIWCSLTTCTCIQVEIWPIYGFWRKCTGVMCMHCMGPFFLDWTRLKNLQLSLVLKNKLPPFIASYLHSCSQLKLIHKNLKDDTFSQVFFVIAGALQKLSGSEEITKLEQQRTLGSPRHRHAVVDKLAELRAILADCILCAACQARLNTNNTMQLLQVALLAATQVIIKVSGHQYRWLPCGYDLEMCHF